MNTISTKLKKFAYPMILPILFLIVWTLLSTTIDNKVIFPKLSSVLYNFSHATENFIGLGSIPKNVAISIIRVLIGYLIGVIVAVPLGIFMGYISAVNSIFESFINVFRPIPPLAWVPLVLGWFGVSSLATVFGITQGDAYVYLNNFKISMIFIIALGTFFPVITNASFGVRNIRTTLIDSARVLGASEHDIFFKILIPGAAPTIVNGLRTGLGIAWACLVSAEMLPGSLSGVGYLITHAYELARTDLVVTGMICIGIVGACLDYMFKFAERKYLSWGSKIK